MSFICVCVCVCVCEESKKERTKEPLDENERGEWEKAGLKLNIQKIRSYYPLPSLHGK